MGTNSNLSCAVAGKGVDVLPTQRAIFRLRETIYPSLRALTTDESSPFAANDQERAPLRGVTTDTRRRIAFISTWFRNHSVGKLLLGVIQRLDRARFQVLIYRCVHFLRQSDELTAAFRRVADRFVDLPVNREDALVLLRQEEIDVAVFPELGMDAWTVALSHQRVARVQCVFWGHPITTGNPVIDYYISSKYFVSDGDGVDTANDADRAEPGEQPKYHGSSFSEQVVLFQGLSTFFSRVGVSGACVGRHRDSAAHHRVSDLCVCSRRQQSSPSDSRAACCTCPSIGDSTSVPRFASSPLRFVLFRLLTAPVPTNQTLMKLHPAFDAVLAGILSQDPLAYVVLLASKTQSVWKEQLRSRFRRSLGEFSMRFWNNRRVLFMPTLPYAEFMALLSFADVILDPFPFGGGVTTLDALALGMYVRSAPYTCTRAEV